MSEDTSKLLLFMMCYSAVWGFLAGLLIGYLWARFPRKAVSQTSMTPYRVSSRYKCIGCPSCGQQLHTEECSD